MGTVDGAKRRTGGATRDFRDYVEALSAVGRGEKSPEEAQKQMPQLRRVGGVCPCSKGLRWVADEQIDPSHLP